MHQKKTLHPRNIHNKEYDYKSLIQDHPELLNFVKKNTYHNLSIDYSDPKAVHCLNQALLVHHYKVQNWSVLEGNLCPGVPGRADYIHHIADILSESNGAITPVGSKIKGLDIGVGTSCIYPILGNSIYGWKFIGSEIDSESINHCKKILKSNKSLQKNIKLRFQKSSNEIFLNLIKPEEKFDFCMCNPPFYSSLEEAKEASDRKVKNLNKSKAKTNHKNVKIKSTLNFGGTKAELWCPGGERAFISKMIDQSQMIKNQCRWFTTLVSNKAHIPELQQQLQSTSAKEIRTIELKNGNKISHLLIWKF